MGFLQAFSYPAMWPMRGMPREGWTGPCDRVMGLLLDNLSVKFVFIENECGIQDMLTGW